LLLLLLLLLLQVHVSRMEPSAELPSCYSHIFFVLCIDFIHQCI
jgi:hypothetical protein